MKSQNQEHEVPQATMDYAVETLSQRKLIPLPEFEELVFKHLNKKYPLKVLNAPRRRNSRTVGMNLVDWVKAYLTNTNATRYFTIHGVRYVAWIPLVGVVQDQDLASRCCVLNLLAALETAVERARDLRDQEWQRRLWENAE